MNITATWTFCESISLPNATAYIYYTGKGYRVHLEIDHATCQALSLTKSSILLSGNASSIQAAKEKADNFSKILENMKVGETVK